ARTVCTKRNRAGRRCGSGVERDGPEGRGGNGAVPAPTAVGGRRAGGTSSASACVCRSNSSSLPESLFSTGSLPLPGCLFFGGFFPLLIAHARPNGSRLNCGRLARPSQAPLFLSSHTFGSQSSTLFSSGSMIHANLPF